MRTQAHRIDDTDPKRGNVVVRVTGTRHDEPTYQVRQSLPNTQEVPGHDHHTNRVRETGSGSHGPILRSAPTNRLTAPGPILGVPSAVAGVVALGLPVGGGGGRRYVVIGLLAVALGLQNATVRRLAVPDLTTTVLTLTLTGLAADSGLASGHSPRARRRLAAVALMAAGALVGALLLRVAVALPVLAATLVIALAAVALRLGRFKGRDSSPD